MAGPIFDRRDFAALDLSHLDAALAARAAPLRLWWRDDDAVAATPQLERLLALADAYDAPIALAVVPATLESSLVDRLATAPMRVDVAVHGWRHANHAPQGEKTAEFGAHRPLETRLAEAHDGLAALTGRFGDRALPVFVPPWNRIADDMPTGLAAIGYHGLSVAGPPREDHLASGLAVLNSTFDPIDWRGSRSIVAPQTLIDRFAALAAPPALGGVDRPIGLLSHHLVHDAPIEAFLDALLSHLHDNAVIRWFQLREAMDHGVGFVAD